MQTVKSKKVAKFLSEGASPFALQSCEKVEECLFPGYYDEEEQTWKGAEHLSLVQNATATATVPSDSDQD